MTTCCERGDHAAASIHRAQAERHWGAAERLRKLGLVKGAEAALDAARRDDRIAAMLEAGRRS